MENNRLEKYYWPSNAQTALDDALCLLLGRRIVRPYNDPIGKDDYGWDMCILKLDSGVSTNEPIEIGKMRTVDRPPDFDTNPGPERFLLYDLQVTRLWPGDGFSVSFLLRPYDEDDFDAPQGVFSALLDDPDAFLDTIGVRYKEEQYSYVEHAHIKGADIPCVFDGAVDRDRQMLLFAKLIFLLLGDVAYHEVSDLEMLSLDYFRRNQKKIKEMEWARQMEWETNPEHPENPALPNRWNPRSSLIFNIPKPLSTGKLIELFGFYASASYERQPSIFVCRSNIYRFAVKALQADDFSRLRYPLELFSESEEDTAEKLVDILEKITVAHELGHHVFRFIADDLTGSERETMANWFACVVLDDYERKLLQYLTTKQPPIYKHLIRMPGAAFTEEQYQQYCAELVELMKEIAK